MTVIQPDLFGDHDRQEAEQRRAEAEARQRRQHWEQPHTCPSCGTQEPNGYLLRNNHGHHPEDPHPDGGRKCTAQTLVTNHITYDARKGHTDALERSMARGRELGLDVEAIRDAARPRKEE